MGGSKYQHKVHLEDFWENVVDEDEIRKKTHSRLLLKIIRTRNIFRVPDQMEDPNMMQKGLKPKMIAQPYSWKRKEVIDLEALSKLVLDFTKWWIECNLEKLVALTNGLTYRLLSHKQFRYERLGQISKGTIVERGTPMDDARTKKGKEVSQEKHPRIDKVI